MREGGALARDPDEKALYLADEDHGVVRCIALPVDVNRPPVAVKVPGPPAQVLAMDGRVLVTIRDPGLLLVMRPDPSAGLVEVARVALPGDTWGIAITPDERTALVSSAWTHRISAIDIEAATLKWTLDVAREPRAIVARPDGKSAYVTHLVGAAVTRLDGIDGGAPSARSIALRPAPHSAPIVGKKTSFDLDASLAYSAALSPDAARLFVPRHALGAQGVHTWFGRVTVDVLLTADDTTLVPDRKIVGIRHEGHPSGASPDGDAKESSEGPVPVQRALPFLQPRAVAYRRSTSTLLVAGEGDDRLAELDAVALDPSLSPLRLYDLAGPPGNGPRRASRCGAPSGLALSADEAYAWVHCRSTGDLAIVKLDPFEKDKPFDASILPTVHLADDALPEKAARGRRAFYDARDGTMSAGAACAACHPEGRDDGHVWQEQILDPGVKDRDSGALTAAPIRDGSIWHGEHGATLHKGHARQTPMLAGRVSAKGPWAWHGKQQIIEQRILVGFKAHGGGSWGEKAPDLVARAEELAAFLRQGLVTPPKERRALTGAEARGRELFTSAETKCATCHFPATDYTDRSLVSVGVPPSQPLFADEPDNTIYKTPSLLFAGGTPPYFHDGRFATLEDLIEQNRDRMGRTEHLSRDDRAALAAFVRTIGVVDEEAAAAPPAKPEPARPPSPVSWALEEPRAPLAGPTARLDGHPDNRSLAPTWPEWKNADPVSLPRIKKRCRVFRVREWLRVNCEVDELAQITLIVGAREGVELTEGRYGAGADIVFPARRGDRRIFEIDQQTYAYKNYAAWEPAVVVTESWLDGDAAPTLTVD